MRFHLEDVYKRPASLDALPGEVTSMWATEGDGVSYAFVAGQNSNGSYLLGDKAAPFYPTATKDSILIPIASSSFLGTYFAKAPQNLPPGSSYSYTAYLAVGSGDVGSVQKVVYDMKDVTIRPNGKEFVVRDSTAYGTISGFVRACTARGPERSGPTTPVLLLISSPGHSARMASTIAAAMSGSQVGNCPMPGR